MYDHASKCISFAIPATRYTRGVLVCVQAINGLQYTLCIADDLGRGAISVETGTFWLMVSGRVFGRYDNGTKGYYMAYNYFGKPFTGLCHFGGQPITR